MRWRWRWRAYQREFEFDMSLELEKKKLLVVNKAGSRDELTFLGIVINLESLRYGGSYWPSVKSSYTHWVCQANE